MRTFGSAAFVAGSFFFVVLPVLAQTVQSDQTFGGSSPEGFAQAAGLATGSLPLVIASIIRAFLGILGLVAVLFVLYGGWLWMLSHGEEGKIKKAKAVLTNALIGMVILFSSFAISQFVLSRLLSAMGTGSSTSSSQEGMGDVQEDVSKKFVLTSVNTGCAALIRNVELQFVFSKSISEATVTEKGGIVVRAKDGNSVEGTFHIAGSRATFTPSTTCETTSGSSVSCFAAKTDYEIRLDASVLKSASGLALECSDTYPCSFAFTTGEAIDHEPPSLEMRDPDDGDSAYAPLVEGLQVFSSDDSGVSSVRFSVDGETVSSVGLEASSVGTLAQENYFDSVWNTEGYATNASYEITAVGSDCAGLEDAAPSVTVFLRPPNCSNGVQDSTDPYFEEGTDCGGDKKSDYYCGSCDGQICTENAECSSGKCEDGICVSSVEIQEVSPGDGAPGNLVTISGDGFGSDGGSVTFMGDPETTDDDKTVGPYTECSGTWADRQVVIQIPEEAVSGPVEVTNTAGAQDRTDDDNGPVMSDFDVNTTKRPGLCALEPASGQTQDRLKVFGNNFGSSFRSSLFYFGSTKASSYPNWGDTAFETVVPSLEEGRYFTQVFVGEGEDREGSNKLSFTVFASSTSGTEAPVITSIDTGVRRCSDSGDLCVSSADCSAEASCDLDPNAAPIGQYVTIYGRGFGETVGTVYFGDQTTGLNALGDIAFPEACQEAFWKENVVLVKVPKVYVSQDTKLVPGPYTLWITRGSDGRVSEPVDFEMIEGSAGPNLCRLSPSSGPPGTDVTLFGEGFETKSGEVTFFDGQTIFQPGHWTDEEIAGTTEKPLQVPEKAETGSIFVKTIDGFSNTLPFEVGQCGEDFSCGSGEECCADGACREEGACAESAPVSHYAYWFSTDDIPDAPSVWVGCTAESVSPTPWESWEGGDRVCLNASLSASFTTAMDPFFFTSQTVQVKKCLETTCGRLEDISVQDQDISAFQTGFFWAPPDGWEEGKTYRVTLKGGDDGIRSSEGLPMETDFTWGFTTAQDGATCTVGSILLSPSEYTATEKDVAVTFGAAPLAEKNQCVLLNCTQYEWSFASSDAVKAPLDSKQPSACSTNALPKQETPPGPPVEISAALKALPNVDPDVSNLTIDFTDPDIVEYWPRCKTACLNSGVGAKFNTAMKDAFDGYEANGKPLVRLFTCQDPACAEDELVEFPLDGTSYNTETFTLNLSHALMLFQANTSYRVILSGELVSLSGVPLSKAKSDLAYGSDLSWTFTTKDSSCTVDQVEVEPSQAHATAVGDRTSFEAVPLSSPDECSVSGQRLEASAFSWDPWTAVDQDDKNKDAAVASLLSSGQISASGSLPVGCSSSCLHTGSTTPSALCGDGKIQEDFGEDCDDGNTKDGDGCSSICLREGGNSVGTCGNTSREFNEKTGAGEDCDDGNTKDGDGCSAKCLAEGASSIGQDCGDGNVAGSEQIGGEECDEGKENAIHNCSSNCLHEGSVKISSVVAICGNGKIEAGEDCDDATTKDGDGCSSQCLREGDNSIGTCGNKTMERTSAGAGEDCDDGNTKDGDGCSSVCLLEGSSYFYTIPSFCGNGSTETGEECEATRVGNGWAPYAVAEIMAEAPAEVLAQGNGSASSLISAKESETGKIGSGTYTLACSCNADSSCDATGQTYGCGEGGCCYARPVLTETSVREEINVCRNAAVWVSFDQAMDQNSFVQKVEDTITKRSLALQLMTVNGKAIDASTYATDCPASHQKAAWNGQEGHSSTFARAWHWMVSRLSHLFGGRVRAADAPSCWVPVTYAIEKEGSGSQVNLQYAEALVANGTYRLVIAGEDDPLDGTTDGVANFAGVGLLEGKIVTFTTGTEICALEYVEVNDTTSPDGFFSTLDEAHDLAAASFTLKGAEPEEIQPLSGVYDWNWAWASTIPDNGTSTDPTNVVDVADASTGFTVATAKANGSESAVATATVTTTSGSGASVSGTKFLRANLCEHPWPDPAIASIFADTASVASAFQLKAPFTNFSFSYCRDQEEGDPLPGLSVVETPDSPVSSVQKELLFLVEGTDDAFGVRVLKNEDYLPPDLWYEEQGFGSAPSLTTLDGYEAIQDGNTFYAAVANKEGGSIYSNIYAISVDNDLGEASREVVKRVLENWKWNANNDPLDPKIGSSAVTDQNLCYVTYTFETSDDKTGVFSDYAVDPATHEFVSCSFDAECQSLTFSDGSTIASTQEGYPSSFCDAEKKKLTRDLRRLTDSRRIMRAVETYGRTHRRCSVTKDQTCREDGDCSGSETCLPDVPSLASGSFLRGFSTSVWSSWTSGLDNALGTTLPVDPLNALMMCSSDGDEDAQDETYCWDEAKGTFSCERGDHVYLYRSQGGEAYQLTVQLEDKDLTPWADSINPAASSNETDYATVIAEYSAPPATSSENHGFISGGVLCQTDLGASGLCGDGVQSSQETCEIGDTTSVFCTTEGGVPGTVAAACILDCSGYQTAEVAVKAGVLCIPQECGNGALDPGEVCDDGAWNGTYGFCGTDCTLARAFFCGDGSLAGGEACDCGSNESAREAGAWSKDHCETSNGQYAKDLRLSCAYDCSYPGPSCGDGEINGSETCDGAYETWPGALCGEKDDFDSCTTDADCPLGGGCGDGPIESVGSCGMSSVCMGGEKAGSLCTGNSFCKGADDALTSDDGVCSSVTYQLSRARSCKDDVPEGVGNAPTCEWIEWGPCSLDGQSCGNGKVEGSEECDDGNPDNTDVCTTLCKKNICGDGYAYKGKESCDTGMLNGTVCEPPYEGTCASCTKTCQYTVMTGAYCGDGSLQEEEGEFCDGAYSSATRQAFCFKPAEFPEDRSANFTRSCATASDCCAGETSCDATAWVCTSAVGVCDGGYRTFSGNTTGTQDYNGAWCQVNSTVSNSRCGGNSSTQDASWGTCVEPACSGDCSSACPTSYDRTTILIQSESPGASKQASTQLYSYLSGNSPDTATLYLPSCEIGTGITAD
ncbi:MAG TPA: hypothetical protein VJB99_03505, partial [Patescibacteria group bacterium]|nr:hypothetical protein [Patescibacteria group bacterium]